MSNTTVNKLKEDNEQLRFMIRALEIRLEEANKRADALYKLAEIVFRNPSYTREWSTNTPVGVPPGGSMMSGFASARETISTT